MTGCLYFSPMGYPALLTDYLVTAEGMNPQFPTPGNVLSLVRGNKRTNAFKLARKLQIIGNRTAIAACGSEDAIRRFFLKAIDVVRDHPERPTLELSRIAGENTPDQLQFIGAHVADPEIMHSYYAGPNAIKKLKADSIGYFYAVGSGREELTKFAERVDTNIGRMRKRKDFVYNPFEVARQVGDNCCANVLNQESYGGPIIKDTWGGFTEYAYYEPRIDQWVYGPSKALIAFRCFKLPSKGVAVFFDSRFLLYRPFEQFAEIFASNPSGDFATEGHWIVESLLHDGAAEDQNVGYDNLVERWAGWRPEAMTFTFNLFDTELKPVRSLIFNNQPADASRVNVELTDEYARVDLEPSYTVEICKKACRAFGLHYRQPEEFTEMDRTFFAENGIILT